MEESRKAVNVKVSQVLLLLLLALLLLIMWMLLLLGLLVLLLELGVETALLFGFGRVQRKVSLFLISTTEKERENVDNIR